MKSKGKLFIISTVVIVLLFVIICVIEIFTTDSMNDRFFTDINSFSKLDKYVVGDIELTNDEYLGDLEVISYYVKEILYGGKKYSVFAYVFSDAESSAAYFKNCTGISTNPDYSFSSSSNLFFNSQYIAFYDCYLYRIEGYGRYKSFVETVNFITETFPLDYHNLYQSNQFP